MLKPARFLEAGFKTRSSEDEAGLYRRFARRYNQHRGFETSSRQNRAGETCDGRLHLYEKLKRKP